jgi:magnesium chelatase family protein
VTVEVDVRRGIPGTEIVGLPGSAVREARERVRVAVRRSGLEYPMDRILVNLSPAGVRKEGTNFDLAIAVAILCASGQLHMPSATVLGELQLTGRVLPVRGVLAAVLESTEAGIGNLIVPAENAAEARAFGSGVVLPVGHLADLRTHFHGALEGTDGTFREAVSAAERTPASEARTSVGSVQPEARAEQRPVHRPVNFSEIQGQPRLKRALEIAAAGRHNMLLVGPPGSGKTMAAHALPGILPELTREEALVTSRIHSLSGELAPSVPFITTPPFRAPHHTASREGVVGGGRLPRPGEASLAHNGVLFLDEAPEFRKPVLQALREPIEDHLVRIARADDNYHFPADFQLLVAANPCPCGMAGDTDRVCLCSGNAIEAYWQRLGGPLLDRIDLRTTVRTEAYQERQTEHAASSREVRERVRSARARQEERHRSLSARYNSRITPTELDRVCELSRDTVDLFRKASEHRALSSRGRQSAKRLARTIADLEGSDRVEPVHVLEAIQHRRSGDEALALLASF